MKTLILLGALSLSAIQPAAAAHSGAAFLSIDPSPRSYALGSTDVIASDGAQAIGQNPANIGLLTRPYEIFTSYQSLIDGSKYAHFALALNASALIPAIDGAGLSFTHLSVSGIPGADASGNYTHTSFSANDTAIAFGASAELAPGLRLGLDLKGVQSQIASTSSNWALGSDIGLHATLTHAERPLSLAFCIDNLGQGLKFGSQTDPLPTAVKLGAALPLGQASMLLAQIQNAIYDGVTRAGVGAEYGMGVAAFRAGYSYSIGTPTNLALSDSSPAARIMGGISAGVGLHWNLVRLDYAISQQAVDYGTTQRVALSIAWGGRSSTRRWAGRLVKSDWVLNSMGDY